MSTAPHLANISLNHGTIKAMPDTCQVLEPCANNDSFKSQALHSASAITAIVFGRSDRNAQPLDFVTPSNCHRNRVTVAIGWSCSRLRCKFYRKRNLLPLWRTEAHWILRRKRGHFDSGARKTSHDKGLQSMDVKYWVTADGSMGIPSWDERFRSHWSSLHVNFDFAFFATLSFIHRTLHDLINRSDLSFRTWTHNFVSDSRPSRWNASERFLQSQFLVFIGSLIDLWRTND